jgi:hypothetical protein
VTFLGVDEYIRGLGAGGLEPALNLLRLLAGARAGAPTPSLPVDPLHDVPVRAEAGARLLDKAGQPPDELRPGLLDVGAQDALQARHDRQLPILPALALDHAQDLRLGVQAAKLQVSAGFGPW